MNEILLNFSGHSLSGEAHAMLARKYSSIFSSPVIDFDFDADPATQLQRLLAGVPFALDGSVSVTIIPPGQATLAVLLFSFLHGMLGHFPRLCYLEMSTVGIYLPRNEYEITLHDVRSAGRTYRSTFAGR